MNDRLQQLRAHNAEVLAHYNVAQQAAALQLYNLVRKHLGTGGGNTAAMLLLGIYNGSRFPFDLTNLRRLDQGNLTAALTVLHSDAAHTYCEIHVLLDAIRGIGSNTGAEFECWAYDLRLKGRCNALGYEECGRMAKESRAAG